VARSTRNQRLVLLAALALCVFGAGLSGVLVMQDVDARSGVSGIAGWVCKVVSPAGDGCAATARSRWARISVPVPFLSPERGFEIRRPAFPVAFLGVAYFISVAVWITAIGRSGGRRMRVLALLLVGGGLAVSATLTSLMLTETAPWCALCAIVHGTNVILVATVGVMVLRKTTTGDAPPAITGRHALTAAALAAALVATAWVYRHERVERRVTSDRLEPYRTLVAALRDDAAFLRREHEAQPHHEFPLRDGETPAPADAVELVMFTDFECPACVCRSRFVRDHLQPMFGANLVVRIRHFPLCGDCNPSVTGCNNAGACAAARAVEAARQLGGDVAFEAARTVILADGWSAFANDLWALAGRIGLDPDGFVRAMDDAAVLAAVADDVALAQSIGVTETPTLYLDGRRVPAICDGPLFWRTMAERHGAVVLDTTGAAD
jgi:predicted DsbA family dithiol-disulfide isomerase